MIRLTLPWLLGLMAALFVGCLILRPLLPVDETRYLAVAWEMHLSGDPLHLTKNFAPYAHKPPLLFWLINLLWLVTGVSELFARFIGPAFALASIWATARLARRFWPEVPGAPLAAALALAAMTVFQLYGSATMFDTMLTLATLIGIGALWRVGEGEAGLGPWIVFGAALGFGTLAKGPVILLHLLPPLLAFRVWADERVPVPILLKGAGVALAVGLGIVALWLIPTLLTATPEFRHELLWSQSVERVAGGMAHDRPFWFLVGLLPVILFPWFFTPPFWRSFAPSRLNGDNAARLCLIWALSALILFSFVASKQPHYLVPELPAIALILAMPLATRPRLAIGGLGAGIAVTIVIHAVLTQNGGFAGWNSRRLAILLSPAAEGDLAVVGTRYNAEVNFTMRLTDPVAEPQDAAALVAWAVAHPNGLVFGPLESSPIRKAPASTLRFAGEDYGVWPAADALTAE